MLIQITALGEAFVANSTDMRSLSRMDQGMNLKSVFSGEGFVTYIAYMRGVVYVGEVMLF